MKRRLPTLLLLGALALLTLLGQTGLAEHAWARGFAPSGRSTADALPWIARADLPPEAQTTLRLIAQGGPFPYERDGIVFGNHERHLPQQARGHYREYTVPTPGIRHRGARRIVHGGSRDSGEDYYTADHYRSFYRIRP